MGQRLEALFGAALLPKEECCERVTALCHQKKGAKYADVETAAEDIRGWRRNDEDVSEMEVYLLRSISNMLVTQSPAFDGFTGRRRCQVSCGHVGGRTAGGKIWLAVLA